MEFMEWTMVKSVPSKSREGMGKSGSCCALERVPSSYSQATTKKNEVEVGPARVCQMRTLAVVLREHPLLHTITPSVPKL